MISPIHWRPLDDDEIMSSPLESLLEEVHLTAQDHTQLPLDTGPCLYSWDNHGQSNPVAPSIYPTGMLAFVNHIRDEHDKTSILPSQKE